MKRLIAVLVLLALASCGPETLTYDQWEARDADEFSRTHVYSESIVIGGVEFHGWIPTEDYYPLVIYPKD